MTPHVTAVLPVFNRAATVGVAIASVLAQSHDRVDVVVVDDGSTDGSGNIARGFGDRVTVLRQERAGPYVARNRALRAAQGDLVAFIDSDDLWLPDRLARQLPLLDPPEVGLVYGDTSHVDAGGRQLGTRSFAVTPPRRGRVLEHFAWGVFVPTITVLARRACFEVTGLFPESQPVSGDALKWFQIARHYELDFVDAVVARYTVHPGGTSSDLGRALDARIRLFTEELAITTDPVVRSTLRRILFNLDLHLALAIARGRARSIRRPLSSALATGRAASPVWALEFGARTLGRRIRRVTAAVAR